MNGIFRNIQTKYDRGREILQGQGGLHHIVNELEGLKNGDRRYKKDFSVGRCMGNFHLMSW